MAAPPTAASAPTTAPRRRDCSRRAAAPVNTGIPEVVLEGSEVTLEGSELALESAEVALDSAGSDADVDAPTPVVAEAETPGQALTSRVEVTVTTEGAPVDVSA